MAKTRMSKNTAKQFVEPLANELADWFYEQGNDEILAHALIAEQIKKIKQDRGSWSHGDKITAQDYNNIINNTRQYLIGKYRVTLTNLRQTKQYVGGYKIATPAEATHILEQRIRRFGHSGRRVIEMLPLAKREFLSRPVKEIWDEAIHSIKEVKGTYEAFLLASDQGEKERKLAERLERKLLEDAEEKKVLAKKK